MNIDTVVIVDFGSQTTQLIARRVRELKVYCQILPCTTDVQTILSLNPKAIILSGCPASVHEEFSPRLPQGILDLDIPVLGICYGMQVYVSEMGGKVEAAEHREFGRAAVNVMEKSHLFDGLSNQFDVWMSHGDQVHVLPAEFKTIAASATCPHAVVECKHFYGVQFHPEVMHTIDGLAILSNFLFRVAKVTPSWEMKSFLQQKIEEVREQVGASHVLMALSGGVDSSVAATLIHRAIGSQLSCVYVDTGLSRLGELDEVKNLFADQLHLNLRVVDAREQFMAALAGVTDPEKKRKIIGNLFIEIFDGLSFQRRLESSESDLDPSLRWGDNGGHWGDNGAEFLGQGTLYPDVIESVSAHGGPTAVIKSHHNVGGLPERMKLKLVEPLRELFKDEVRLLGRELGLPANLIERQPFPGPGLAVRILGEVTHERCHTLAKADAIVRHEIESAGIAQTLWQWFAVLLPVRSVGVMGDARTYGETVVVRCVESTDGMTADWAELPKSVLARISGRIINEVKGISRVVYDISSKPPSTIEWE